MVIRQHQKVRAGDAGERQRTAFRIGKLNQNRYGVRLIDDRANLPARKAMLGQTTQKRNDIEKFWRPVSHPFPLP